MIETRIEDGIAVLTWNVANRPMNVMNQASLGAFEEALEAALADDAVSGILIASARPEFIVGADLKMFEGLDGAAAIHERLSYIQRLFRRMETGGKPAAAAIAGHALGGGLEICLAAHHRVVADDPKIKLGLPEAKVGLFPGAGGTQRLPRLIGIQAALPLILQGTDVPPQKALELGFVDRVVARDALLDSAIAWLKENAGKPAQKPWDRRGFKIPGGGSASPNNQQAFTVANAMLHAKTWNNFPAQRNAMSAVYEGHLVDFDTALTIETRYVTATIGTPEAKNLIRNFFALGEANKLADRPKGIEKRAFAKIGVIGAGMMGAGIAFVAARAGLKVVLIDTDEARAAAGKSFAQNQCESRVQRGRMSAEEAEALLARIAPTAAYDGLGDANLVIEAVFEDRAVKAAVTKAAEAVLADTAIVASNTSTLPITGLAEASIRPARFIGLHFFSPVERMPLVEIIRGAATDDATLAAAMDFCRAIAKTPIVVNDSRGFYTSRVFATYLREGLAMLAEGVKPALIENAGRMAGMPVGPLALADEVSLSLMAAVAAQTRADLGAAAPDNPADPVVATMLETCGRAGKAAGKGFYDYPAAGAAGRKRLWSGLGEQFPPVDYQPSLDGVIERLMLIQSVETARCLAENVVVSPRDADVGAVLGWGFAPQRGGPIGQIESMGLDAFIAACDRLAQAHGPRFQPPASLRAMAERGERFYAAA